LTRRVHFPPDILNAQVIRKREIDSTIQLDYDPAPLQPNYIVVGRFGQLFQIYDRVLASGHYARVEMLGDYAIYRRRNGIE